MLNLCVAHNTNLVSDFKQMKNNVKYMLFSFFLVHVKL